MTAEQIGVPSDEQEHRPELIRLRDDAMTVTDSDEDIRGRLVRDANGEEIGKVEGLLIDASEKKIRFMEVASGGFLGLGERKSLIPIEAITSITPDEVKISHSRAHVAGAPEYDPDLASDDSGYFSSLYPYYGYPGYMGIGPWDTQAPSPVRAIRRK